MIDQTLEQLVVGEHRSKANITRNIWRHPVETLKFFGLTPDQTVLEVLPALGWYTEILAPYLARSGRLYVAHFSPNSAEEYMIRALEAFEKRIVSESEVFGRVLVRPILPPHQTVIAPNESVDLAMVFRNIHNWVWIGQEIDYFSAIFEALKPGGILGIEQHRAEPNMPLDVSGKSHYLTEQFVIESAEKVGFKFVESCEINRNPRDSKDHPQSAWSLPPFLMSEEREKYLAIGESDRMTLKFAKPVT